MITIVGLGEVGLATFREISKKSEVMGVDVNSELIEKLVAEGLNVSTELPENSNVYIIDVYTPEQVLSVLDKINYGNKPLVIIESTLKPGTIELLKNKNPDIFNSCDLVLFPHRFNANDLEHSIFNLHRIIGGATKEATERAINFYSQFMDRKLIHVFPIGVVELSKPLENAYRYAEIAIAEELKMLCDEKGINFEKLREAANTKWNIDIKEAREGIGGKCLPKDIKIMDGFFRDNKIFNTSIDIDKEYVKKTEKK